MGPNTLHYNQTNLLYWHTVFTSVLESIPSILCNKCFRKALILSSATLDNFITKYESTNNNPVHRRHSLIILRHILHYFQSNVKDTHTHKLFSIFALGNNY